MFVFFAKNVVSSKLEIVVHRKQKERGRFFSKKIHMFFFEVTETIEGSNLHTVKLPLTFQTEQSEALFSTSTDFTNCYTTKQDLL